MGLFLMMATGVLIAFGSGPARAAFDIEVVESAGQVGDGSSIAIDANGDPHVIYRAAKPACPPYPPFPYYGLHYAHRTGGSWTIETILSGPCPDFARPPQIALDSNGEPRILYDRSRSDGQTLHDLVYAARIGGVWTFETIETSTAAWNDPALALDASDVPHVSFGDNALHVLKYAVKVGETWTVEVVDATDQAGGYTDLDLDPSGNPSISYFAYVGSKLRFATKSEGSWSVEEIEASVDLAGCTSLKVDSQGTPHVGFARPSGNLSYATKQGGNWVVVLVTEAVGHPAAQLQLALDSDDHPHVVYQDRDTDQLFYVFYTGTEWLLYLVDAGPAGDETAIAIDDQDRSHVTYYQPVNEDFHYATSQLTTGVESGPGIPESSLRLFLHPNPSRNEMTLTVDLAGMVLSALTTDQARVGVLDSAGRRVRTLVPTSVDGSSMRFVWDGRDGALHHLPSGVYRLDLMLDGKRAASRLGVRLR